MIEEKKNLDMKRPLLQNQTESKCKIRDHSCRLDGKLESNNFLLSIKGYETGK